jgi:hypothetical protein
MLMLLGSGLPLTLRNIKLIEAVAAFLALFSAGIFVAHAVDAYTQVAQVAEVNEAVRNGENRQRS